MHEITLKVVVKSLEPLNAAAAAEAIQALVDSGMADAIATSGDADNFDEDTVARAAAVASLEIEVLATETV